MVNSIRIEIHSAVSVGKFNGDFNGNHTFFGCPSTGFPTIVSVAFTYFLSVNTLITFTFMVSYDSSRGLITWIHTAN